MSSATGSATLSFGTHPGSNEASVAVTGQGAVLATSKVEAFFMADDTTGSHTASDHKYIGLFVALVCGTPTASTGFTIYARSEYKMTGDYTVRWVWVD